ncbi:MAG: tetratricopeptide repeat protein [Bryobacterales bacterium]|nr:tetratricopeptide repeat protein [Bryobacterales bacterium]
MTEAQLQNAAVAASNTGRHDDAVAMFRQLLDMRPQDPAFHANLGLAFVRAGNSPDAILSYRTAVSLRPNHAPTLAKLGRVLASAGDRAEAQATFRRALAIDPGNADTWNALGAVNATSGDFEPAVAIFRRALELDPTHDEARGNLVGVLLRLGEKAVGESRWDAALEWFGEGIRLDPNSFDCHYNRALALAGAKKFDEALAGYRRALELRPNDARALNNIGHVLLAQGKPEEAFASLQLALEADPDYLGALYNLGATRQHQGRYAEAGAYYEEVLRRNPAHADTLSNLGSMLLAQAKPEQAVPYFDQAIAAAPDHYDARWNRSLSLLSAGNYRDGWQAYEVRLTRKNQHIQHNERPRWQGEPVAARPILVWAEQGLGDTVQFLRFLEPLRALGAHVLFECQDRVLPLAACVPTLHKLLKRSDKPPSFDYQIPLMSLPAILGIELDNLPAPTEFRIPVDRLEKWAHVANNQPALKVGFCWAGNPHHPTGASRQIPLAALASLTQAAGCRFFSLQRGSQENLEEAERLGICNIETEDNDIVDTAAIVKHLDLVITVDTMIAHLAASLGKPTWILLPFAADWRWLVGREDSPWYPAARLFRQKQPNDWESAVSAVRQALEQRLTAGG